jgi:hypothetical protein
MKTKQKFQPKFEPVEINSFRDLCICAGEMRQLQKWYFNTGSIEALQRAKAAEKRFDLFYHRMINDSDTIPTKLF